ncbi:universal stress protein [Streptomyces sp. NPDC056160]|uniref:universal stress protein n=1 Tax=Streptomyces sp. NPDC056160 TaxID=3345731 RepID=UPI0035DFFC77
MNASLAGGDPDDGAARTTVLPLVVGVDGSAPSLRAVDWAADEAVLRRLPLRLVYAPLWERYEGAQLAGEPSSPDAEELVELIVRAAARRARHRQADLSISTATLPESPEYALVSESENASALVVGSRGRGNVPDILLGSVSLWVAAHADCPVIVVRGSHDEQARVPVHGRVVVGVGGAAASAAVEFAADEAGRRGAVLEAVRAWRRPAHETIDHALITRVSAHGYEPQHGYEQQAAEALEAALLDIPADVKVQRRLVEGPARRVLLDAACEADLLVVGACRRAGHFGLQLGRVAHTVLHHSPCPVAVVPVVVADDGHGPASMKRERHGARGG